MAFRSLLAADSTGASIPVMILIAIFATFFAGTTIPLMPKQASHRAPSFHSIGQSPTG
jgi:hypothetical protein